MSRTLLLADENVTTHRIVTLTFAKHDVRVISVVDGIQAIERIERDRPDIILADANLPRLNGYEIAQYVTSRPQLNRMPVLILMGAFDTIDESRVRQSGAAGVIVRPVEPAVVINKVKELFGFGDKLVPASQVVPRRAPVPAAPQSRPPRPSEAGPQPVVPRTGPVAVPPARAAELPTSSAAGDQLRHESGPGAGATALESPAGAAEDYFDRLDAAFDTLDAQLAGRLPNRPASARREPPASFGEAGSASVRREPRATLGEAGSASARQDTHVRAGEAEAVPAQRDLRPSGDPTQTAETVADAADPPVFEVDADWFAESPRDDEGRALSTALSQARSVEPTPPNLRNSPPDLPDPPDPVRVTFPTAAAAPPSPPVLTPPSAPPASEQEAPYEHYSAREHHTLPSAPKYRTDPSASHAPNAPAAPKYRTAPSAPDAPRAPVASAFAREEFEASSGETSPKRPAFASRDGGPLPLADAFDALLAAEERRDQRLISARDQQMSEFSDDVIDRIATRVAERLADSVLIDAVRKGVAAITERLVRDEIERNRANAQRKT